MTRSRHRDGPTVPDHRPDLPRRSTSHGRTLEHQGQPGTQRHIPSGVQTGHCPDWAPGAAAVLLCRRHRLPVVRNADLAETLAPILSVLTVGAFSNSLMRHPYELQFAPWLHQSYPEDEYRCGYHPVPPDLLFSLYGAVGVAWLWVLTECWLCLNCDPTHASQNCDRLNCTGNLRDGGIYPVRRQSCATGDLDIPAGA